VADRDDARGSDAAPEQSATVDARSLSEGDLESGPRATGSDLIVGQTFAGRYEVQGLVGRGGMGSVWRVRDAMVGEVVALKTLHLAQENTEKALERFRREVRLARRITSPHVARTHDLGTQGDVHYLTMEHVEGASLTRVLEKEKVLPPDRAARIAAQIADGLVAAHAAGVVHRDLKPDNVLVESKTQRVVVTDFGIARALQDTDAAQRTGGIVGTPMYMAPEQVAGAPIDERADVYALGLVLFELLTGAAAFWAETPIASAVKRLHTPPRDPREMAAVPDALASIVMKCLQRDPSQRYPDAASVAAALHAFAGSGGHATPKPGSVIGAAPSSVGTPSPSTSAQRPLVAPLLKGDRALAVLSFVYRGPTESDWLGGGIRDELIDALSRTRGLRVLGRGAVEKLDDRDPRALGSQLGVEYVVDGTVQVAGPRLRVTVRLLEVATGTQLWTERFDSDLEDLFVVQERVAQRIAEALRLGLHGVGLAVAVPPEAVELYMRARRGLRTGAVSDAGVIVGLLERVIDQAPDFGPAYALHAIACVRAWFMPHLAGQRDWQKEAQASIARAMERAPDLAETHYARAQLAANNGQYRDAVQATKTALAIAPTLAEAHQFLGMMQIEAGRAKEGLQRIELALALEPTLTLANMEKARWNGLYGDLATFDAIMEKWGADPVNERFLGQQLIRVGAFRDDRARVQRGRELVERGGHPAAPALALYASVVLGQLPDASALEPLLTILSGPVSARFRSLIRQLAAEAWGKSGDVEKTMEHFRAACEDSLLDIEWIDRCPLLACIRKHPDFPALRQKVRTRCEDIWNV
jgi:serine/threonine-protein kinase